MDIIEDLKGFQGYWEAEAAKYEALYDQGGGQLAKDRLTRCLQVSLSLQTAITDMENVQ